MNKLVFRYVLLSLLLPFFLLWQPVFAQQASSEHTHAIPDIQPLSSIAAAVDSFIKTSQPSEQTLDVHVKQLDRRLRLAYCQAPLQTMWSPGSRSVGRVTVQVACDAPKNWRIRVQATVTMDGEVWTLQRGVQRGETLTKDLLVRQEITLGANNASFSTLGTPLIDIEPWLGFVFTQRVNAGKVLTERMLKPAKLIAKGEAVLIRHRSSGLSLQTRGVALADAGARQQTQVRNTSSGKVVDAIAVSPGIVEVLH